MNSTTDKLTRFFLDFMPGLTSILSVLVCSSWLWCPFLLIFLVLVASNQRRAPIFYRPCYYSPGYTRVHYCISSLFRGEWFLLLVETILNEFDCISHLFECPSCKRKILITFLRTSRAAPLSLQTILLFQASASFAWWVQRNVQATDCKMITFVIILTPTTT